MCALVQAGQCKQDSALVHARHCSVYRAHSSNGATVSQLHNALDHARHYIHHVHCSTERYVTSAAPSGPCSAARAALASYQGCQWSGRSTAPSVTLGSVRWSCLVKFACFSCQRLHCWVSWPAGPPLLYAQEHVEQAPLVGHGRQADFQCDLSGDCVGIQTMK